MKNRIILPIALVSLIINAQKQKFDIANKKATIIVTNKNTDERLKEIGTYEFKDFPQPKETDICVFVNPDYKYQKIIGIGGAITDAAAETFAKLPKAKQEELLAAYYGKSGLNYNIVRTNMNSCDFSSDSYTYVQENDKSLKSFDLSHDRKYKIPLIQLAKQKIGSDFKLYFSPWSPPAWMKDNGSMLKGGHLKKEYYQTWAEYYVKFIQEYQKTGLPVWGLTIQNEPMASQTWESCIYSAEEEADFLKNNLGPTLWKNGFKDKKVIIWDHNRDLLFQRATTTLADPETSKYASGIGYHWYETWTKSLPLYQNVEAVHEAFPEKFMIFTEGCIEKFDYTKINDWSLGEFYGKNMIHDFNNGLSAWTDWNILLDETGGPNHVGNFCYAPIIADTKTGELHYTPEYYYIGHLSKYVRPNAYRTGTTTNRDFLLSTSFVNEDGKLVVIVMNESDKNIKYNLWIKGKSINIDLSSNSIQTIVI